MSRPAGARSIALVVIAAVLALMLGRAHGEIDSFAARPDLPAHAVRSGTEFLTAETRALQADDFANPGYLWVQRGRELFEAAAEGGACADCHAGDGEGSLRGAATRYPQVDVSSGALIDLPGRIDQCAQGRQGKPALARDSEELLALTAHVTNLSQGMPYDVAVDGAARPWFEQGRDYFFRRRGQFNLACTQCHDEHWGRMLRGDRISQGHPTAWPAYRLEWQTFGSLHRRLQDCDAGVRAEPHAAGSEIYTSVELYLAWRARTLPLESPGIRR